MSAIEHFVHDALAGGKSRPEIARALTDAGWSADEVHSALDEFADLDFPVPVPRRKPTLSARDAFQHLLAFLTLYLSALGAGTLLFQLVNLWLPDPLQSDWMADDLFGLVRAAAAGVIIALPVYLWTTRGLEAGYRADPARRSSPVRQWLTYFTLFVTAAIVLGYLIALVYQLLGGQLLVTFALKTVIVLALAGAIFGHYLPGLRREEKKVGGDALATA